MFEKAAKHAFSNAWLNGITGGNMKHGFVTGFLSSLGNEVISNNVYGEVPKIACAAVLGGTIEEIGGGKFANGAITGAYGMLFNDLMHKVDEFKIDESNMNDDTKDIMNNGRMYKSESEAMSMAVSLTSEYFMETHVSTVVNSDGVSSYFLDSFCNNTPERSYWNNERYLKAAGYTITEDKHFSIYRPLNSLPTEVNTVSKLDFRTAFSANIPITHCTIGFGQWEIDKFGLFSRFIPFSRDINRFEFQRSFFNAK
jgi:hypothetical protein